MEPQTISSLSSSEIFSKTSLVTNCNTIIFQYQIRFFLIRLQQSQLLYMALNHNNPKTPSSIFILNLFGNINYLYSLLISSRKNQHTRLRIVSVSIFKIYLNIKIQCLFSPPEDFCFLQLCLHSINSALLISIIQQNNTQYNTSNHPSILIFGMESDSYEFQCQEFPTISCQLNNELFMSSTQNSEILYKAPKSKNYKQTRLNQKNNFEQLKNRIKQMENQIKNQKAKKEYCYRCGRSLTTKDCEVKHYTSKNSQQMQFQPFDQGIQPPKLKGQIWIAIGMIMLLLGHSLYGLYGQKQQIHLYVDVEEHESINDQLSKRECGQSIKLSTVLSNYEPSPINVQQTEVYAESIVTMIENSKDYASLISFSGW